jgi:His/Glu/Gln/Arg/opine family amino acid ABC transporter permease subunit
MIICLFKKVAAIQALLFFCVFVASAMSCEAQGAQSIAPLQLGLTGKLPPLNYFDEKGQLTGFDVEVAKELCRTMQRECKFVTLEWDGILASLLAGKLDLIVGSMAVTPERQKKVLFSDTYYESGPQIFAVEADFDPSKPGARIGVTLGTTYEAELRRRFDKADVRTFKDEFSVVQDLVTGRMDALITDSAVGSYMARQFGISLHKIGAPLVVDRFAIPARPGREALIKELNVAIQKLRASPRYEELKAQFLEQKTDQGALAFRWGTALKLLGLGLISTLRLASLGLLFGVGLALLLAIARLSGIRPLIVGVKLFTDFIRCTPFLIQLFAIYFGLPALGVALPALVAAILTIALHSSAFLSETLVAGFRSIPKAQRQAAALLGLSNPQIVRRVVFPQMVPIIAAPVLNTVVATIKDSAVVSVISVYELTMQAQQLISTTYRPFEFYLLAAFLYAIINYPLILWGRRWARRPGEMGAL